MAFKTIDKKIYKTGENMKLKHYKRKNIIIIITTCLILSAIIFGVTYGCYGQFETSKYNAIDKKPPLTEIDKTPENDEPKANSIINAVDGSKTEGEPSASSMTPSTPSNNQQDNQPTYVAPIATPQQPEPQEQVATCSEEMKLSYTSLYNSQVTQENASWANQISLWQSDAASRGMGFSGYVQGMVDGNKPAHDAILTQLQAQYYLNLASINCDI